MKFLPVFLVIASIGTLAAAPHRASTPPKSPPTQKPAAKTPAKPAPAPPRAAAPAPDAPVPFKVGETLTYDASWSSFLTAGQVKMRVADRQNLGGGRSGYHFVSEAQ